MTDESKTYQWHTIEIEYYGGGHVRIQKEDLDKIDAIGDVINALHHGKDLVEKLKNILK